MFFDSLQEAYSQDEGVCVWKKYKDMNENRVWG